MTHASGRIVTAMITPFDERGELDLSEASAAGAMAGRSRERRSGRCRLDRRGPDARRGGARRAVSRR